MFWVNLLLSSSFFRNYDEDFVDMLINRVTPFLMGSLAMAGFINNIWGNPMTCWPKAEWNNSLIEYANSLCFSEGTFIVPTDQPLPKGSLSDDYQKMIYYRWVPFVFLLMGIAPKLPLWFWKWITSASYFDIYCKPAVNTLAVTCKPAELFRFTVNLDIAIAQKRFNSYRIFIFYMVKKLLNSFVIIIMIKMLSYFIAENPHDHFGIDQLDALLFGHTKNTTNFPMKTVCEFYIEELGLNKHPIASRKVVDCTLNANAFLRKIYVYLWVWLASLFIVNALNCCWWLWNFLPFNIKSFLRAQLIRGAGFEHSPDDDFQNYWITRLYRTIPLDGMFLLKMVDNKGGRTASRITGLLFKFRLREAEKELNP